MGLTKTEMENDAQIVVRLPLATADRLKSYAARLTREFGVRVSMAEATRKLIAEGLDAAEQASAGETAKAKTKERGARGRKP